MGVAACGSVLALLSVALAVYMWWGRMPVCGELPQDWYVDELSHTGDVLFFSRSHAALVVMHTVTGEPWVVELVRGGVRSSPARARLRDCPTVYVARRVQPMSATKVLEAASKPMRCTCAVDFVARVLAGAGAAAAAGGRPPATLWHVVGQPCTYRPLEALYCEDF